MRELADGGGTNSFQMSWSQLLQRDATSLLPVPMLSVVKVNSMRLTETAFDHLWFQCSSYTFPTLSGVTSAPFVIYSSHAFHHHFVNWLYYMLVSSVDQHVYSSILAYMMLLICNSLYCIDWRCRNIVMCIRVIM